MTVTISRLYKNYDDAKAAVANLEAAGVAHNDVSILASNADNWYSDNKVSTYPDRDLDGKDDRVEAVGAGSGVGAAVGGVAGLLAGLGIMAIPGVGPVVAAGWLVSTLAGGAAGGALGALTQAGVSNEDAEVYAEGLRRGGAVVSARVPDRDAARLQAIMDNSAVNIGERAAAYRRAGWQSFNPKATPYTAEQIRKERELYMRR